MSGPSAIDPTTRVLVAALLALAAALAWAACTAGAAEAKPLPDFQVKIGAAAAPVVASARTSGKREITFVVNGKRLPASEVYGDGPRRRVVELSASDGLEPGRNTISARTTRRAGTVSESASVRISRSELLADAGDDLGAIVAAPPVALGMPFAGPAGLQQRWKMLATPADADYTLRGRSGPRPTLSATTPGTYRLRLTAKRDGKPVVSRDTLTVAVDSNTPPIGIPINTIAANGAIQIGSTAYGGGGEIAWAVLERSTGAVVESGTSERSDAGIKRLAALADKYRSGSNFQRYDMIVSGRSGIPAAQLAGFASVAKRLGSPVLSEENFAALRAGLPFTIFGVPGGARGAATTRIAPGGYDPAVSGAITGYLQKNQAVAADGTQIYDLAQPDHLSYDTHSGGSGITNQMTINGQQISGSLPPGATAGFHVVTYESLTMRQLSNQFLTTNGGPGSVPGERQKQADVATALKASLDRPGGPLVFVQSIGKPSGAGPEWSAIVKQLARIGANANFVNALDGTATYAIVGTVRSTQPPVESSDAYDKGPYAAPNYPPARLTGIVARARDSRLVPTIAGTPTTQQPDGGVNSELIATAWQGATAWPQLAPGASAAERAAVTAYFCSSLGFCKAADSCNDIRACYWQRYSADWEVKLSTLNGLTYPGGSPGYTTAQFDAVKTQLQSEISAVASIQRYIDRLQRPFEKSGSRSSVDLKQISDEIYNGLQRPPSKTSTSYVLDLIAKALKLGGLAGPPASAIASGISGAFELAAFLTKDRGGEPILGGEVRARADQLGKEVFARIDAANEQLDGLGLLLVSDYGKLTKARDKIDTSWALPATDAPALKQLSTASKQWFYTALVPAAYPYLIRANAGNARNLDCMVTDNRRAWPNQPDDAQMLATTGYDNAGNSIKSIFFFARGMGGAMSPPGGLGTKIFAPLIGPTTGLGIEKLEFFAPRTFGGSIAHAVQGDRSHQCQVGWLPKQW